MKKTAPIIISLEDKQLTDEEQDILTHPNVGGIILFSRNFTNKKQLIELTNNIKTINPDLLIMVDHEGGKVWRFKTTDFTNPGPMQQLGILYQTNPELALETSFNYGKQIASQLINCYIDLNLAPVLDLNHNHISSVIGDRAMDSDPYVVAKLAEQFIRGQQSTGMQAVGKHFPGHGAIATDSHLEVAIDYRAQQTIFDLDLKVFKLLIENNRLPALMPAHVIYKTIDEAPAGFSKIWLQDVLRTQLNFKGTIISDCLSMQAAQQFIKRQIKQNAINLELAYNALTAGCDLIIFNGLHGNNLLHLLDNLAWQGSLEQISRINSLKLRATPHNTIIQ